MPKPKPPRPTQRKPVYTPSGIRSPQQPGPPTALTKALATVMPWGAPKGTGAVMRRQRGRSR
jgi:hypothetical protein